jgi:hypothetical protein
VQRILTDLGLLPFFENEPPAKAKAAFVGVQAHLAKSDVARAHHSKMNKLTQIDSLSVNGVETKAIVAAPRRLARFPDAMFGPSGCSSQA